MGKYCQHCGSSAEVQAEHSTEFVNIGIQEPMSATVQGLKGWVKWGVAALVAAGAVVALIQVATGSNDNEAYNYYYQQFMALFRQDPNAMSYFGSFSSPSSPCTTAFSVEALAGRIPSSDDDAFISACLNAYADARGN